MGKARSLPPLSAQSVEQWRDLALATLKAHFPNWTYCVREFLPGRYQTAMTKLQKKADKGTKYGSGARDEFDEGMSKSMISLALLEEFTALLKIK